MAVAESQSVTSPQISTATATATTTTTTTTTTATATTNTTRSTSSTVRATTSSTSTSSTTVPVPIDPPDDPYTDEPVIEVGRITIPKIGVDATMYEGIRLTTLDHGPGHWPGTALPGQTGNVVVAGHRVSKHQVFRHVDQLERGDDIVLTDANGEHRYVVSQVQVVDPNAIWIVDQTPTATATLFACHPPGSTKQRIVVFADLVTE